MTRATNRQVPLLLTADLEIAEDHDVQEQTEVLNTLNGDLNRLGVPCTFFSTAVAAERFAAPVKNLGHAGHEIACHGLTHSAREDYSRMRSSSIHNVLREATTRLEQASGTRPRCFRGPGMSSSSSAQAALVDLGYRADFSVCSQRIDIANSKGGQLGWLHAPRRPYRPAPHSPFRRGSVPIYVIPLSCLGIPFLSGMLFLMGLTFMKSFYAMLLAEARVARKPIVYAFHPYEFTRYTNGSVGAQRQKWLHRLYRQDRQRRYEDTLALVEHMSAPLDVTPMIGNEYVAQLSASEV